MEDIEDRPQKRFRYATYNQQLAEIQVDKGKGKGVAWDDGFEDEADDATPFTVELDKLSILDLTTPFQNFTRQIRPLTTSLPVTLHNLTVIQDAFRIFYADLKTGSDHIHSGLDSVLQLHKALFETCGSETLGLIPKTAEDMLRLGSIPALDPSLVERAFSVLSLVLRDLAASLLAGKDELRETWLAISPYLASINKPYVRRCATGAWVGIVRKARGDGLDRLLSLLMDEEPRPGTEAMWAESLQGPSNALHSRALPILERLLDRTRLDSGGDQLGSMTKILSATVHHCSSKSLAPVVDAILSRIFTPAEPSTSTTPSNVSTAMLHLLGTTLFVRKGKRFPQDRLKPAMLKLIDVCAAINSTVEAEDIAPVGEDVKETLVFAIAGCLSCGQLPSWLSPGVKLLDASWQVLETDERFKFVNTLLDLQWSGFAQFMTSRVFPFLDSHFDDRSSSCLLVLAKMHDFGLLSGTTTQDKASKEKIISRITARLGSFNEITSTDSADLQLLDHLYSALAIVQTPSEQVITALFANMDWLLDAIRSETSLKDYWSQAGPSNLVHLLASLLRSIESLLAYPGVEQQVRKALLDNGHLREIMRMCSWNREILDVLASLMTRFKDGLGIDQGILDSLQSNLLSSDPVLRKATLRMNSLVASPQADFDLWKLCLEVESAEMTLKNVRERTTNIKRVGRHLQNALNTGSISDTTVNRAITYLMSQLKVNFRPLYAETVATMGELVPKCGEAIWSIIWAELGRIDLSEPFVPDLNVTLPSWASTSPGKAQPASLTEENDSSLVCTNLLRICAIFERVWESPADESLEPAIQAQISDSRLDVLNYETQLLAALRAASQAAEKHSRLLVPHALHVLDGREQDGTIDSKLSTRKRHDRQAAYLELLGKYVNPKAAYRSDDLHAAYLKVLQKGEPTLQNLALDCLMTYKSSNLVPYNEKFRGLLDDHKFRDSLIHLPIGLDSEVIDPAHRAEIVPVTIRLLYGIITSRRGRSSTVRNLKARKQAVLTALSGCSPAELETLVNLMLGSIEDDSDGNTPRQQIGFLTLLSDVVRLLGSQTVTYWPRVITKILRLVDHAQTELDGTNTMDVDAPEDGPDEDVEESPTGHGAWRSVRTAGVKRLVQLLRSPVPFDWHPYLEAMYASVISPRLDKLEMENTQAPSATMDLIAAIAASPDIAESLNTIDKLTLSKTFACLNSVKVKQSVILRVFDIVDSLMELDGPEESQPASYLLSPHSHILISCLIKLVESTKLDKDDKLLPRLLSIISRLAAIVSDGAQAQQLAGLLAPMLRQRGKVISERSKADILRTLQHLYRLCPDYSSPDSEFFQRQYTIVANLFQTLASVQARKALVTTFQAFANIDESLDTTITWTSDLNAFSIRRMEEPDFDKRLAAYGKINDAPLTDLPAVMSQWLPLVRNSAFFIREVDELSIRTSASKVLQRFLDVVGQSSDADLMDAVTNVLLPGLRETLRTKHESVRNEALLVISHAVTTCPNISILHEMQPLITDDEQTNFFHNVAHIQVHRRARALRRLRDVLDAHEMSESTIFNLLLPILEHIISGSTDVTDHHLVNEAISSIGSLAGKLRWSRYYGLLLRYLRLGTSLSPQQKLYIRSVTSIIEHFSFDIRKVEIQPIDDEAAIDEQDVDPSEPLDPISTLIQDAITAKLLPSLSRFLESRKEATETIRIPTALAAVKLAHHLPDQVAEVEILKFVTAVCQALRSKDQDTRDTARDTVCRIAIFLGPKWLARVLKELQSALQRGPQKHVAAVTTHAILARATTEAADAFGDLDDSVEDAVRISAEVIWGQSGSDSTNDEYKTKMREVKSAPSRAFDTFQLLARLVQPTKISAIMAPIREILHVTQAVQSLQQVDEALRRVSSGFNANTRIHVKDILHLCYALASGTSSYSQQKRKAAPTSQAKDDYRVQMKRDQSKKEDYFAVNSHKLITFGLDLFVTAYRRGKLDFEDTEILSRLGPLVGVIGDSLYSKSSDVLSNALKATAAIARCPIPKVNQALPVFIKNIFSIIKHAGGTAESDMVQTALKTLAVILRDCKTAKISDMQLKYLVDIISPDLEEHDRQSALFTILRAIVSRKFVIPEIYDLMDRVSGIMVTSQSTHVQELSRLTLMQFLLDYPQGKARLKSQMTFLAQNLDYQFESGRLSIMEVLAAVFRKFSDELLEQYADLFFVALTAVLANDESDKCRTAAGALLQQLWSRVDSVHQSKWMSIMEHWISAGESEGLVQASLVVLGLICDVDGVPDGTVSRVVDAVTPTVIDSAGKLEAAEEDPTDPAVLVGHEVIHHSLNTLHKATRRLPAFNVDIPHQAIISHLLYPHGWVRYDAARLLTSSITDAAALIKFQEDDSALFDVARKGCLVLSGNRKGNRPGLDSKLADQVVKLLWHLAKLWKFEKPSPTQEHDDASNADEEVTAKHPLAWLMSRMSFIARQMIVDRPRLQDTAQWTKPLMSVLRFFAGTFEDFEAVQARRFAIHALAPLYRILDDSGEIAALEATDDIVALRQFAIEVRDSIQSKVGTTQFSQAWENVRRRVSGRREERKDARARMAVSDPKAWAKRQGKRVMLKKESKKRRTKAFAEGRIAIGKRR